MSTQDFINTRYARVLDYDVPANKMEERNIFSLPRVENVKYNEVLTINASFLFCDIKGYTELVSKTSDPKTIARIMTIYVTEMAAAIRQHSGTILSIRGDGIIGAFTNSDKDNASIIAVDCSITQSSLLNLVVNKRLKSFQQEPIYCHWGAEYGKIKITRAGIHGDGKNDLIYIGNAINYASKFSVLADKKHLVISESLYDQLDDFRKDSKNNWNSSKIYDQKYGNCYKKVLNKWSNLVEPT